MRPFYGLVFLRKSANVKIEGSIIMGILTVEVGIEID